MSYDSFVRQSEEVLREAPSSWAEDQRRFIRHAVRRLGPNVVVNAKLLGDERFCAAEETAGAILVLIECCRAKTAASFMAAHPLAPRRKRAKRRSGKAIGGGVKARVKRTRARRKVGRI